MEKQLRSVLQSSAEEFLATSTAAVAAATSSASAKQLKTIIKSLIWKVTPSSSLPSSLPPALHTAISCSLDSLKISLQSDGSGAGPSGSPLSPPSKRPRRSYRSKRSPSPDQESPSRQLEKLNVYTHVTDACATHPKKCFDPEKLLPSIKLLHDNLLLYEDEPALMSAVAALCEMWWKELLPGRQTLITLSLPYVLSRSLEMGKKVDVHRVYALREAFTLLDFVDESIEDLRLLMLRCVITPIYLKTDEGKRFLSFMLGLNRQLSKEVLNLVRSQIPFGRKSVLEAYAEIIFKAWKSFEESMREEIEDGFLQGLIEGAVLASTKSLGASIRRVLGGFIEQRVTDGVEKLLYRLAEPILFRSLQVANSNVRLNALLLLIDLFPLEDPDLTREAKHAFLEKQFFLLDNLLLDVCPDVRAVSVEGICRILSLFWEVIPTSTITSLLTKIVEDMSHDMCHEVRLSMINGMIFLLGNPQSHDVLKVLLPRLGCVFLDPTLSVRIAVADLLLAVRDIRAIQFHKVVDLNKLISSLENDQPPVARKITRLLIPSYFPSKLSTSEACSRCIALIKGFPVAGSRFCEFALDEGASSTTLLELAKASVRILLSSKDLNPDQIDGLFNACANICHNLSNETSSKDVLTKLFSKETIKGLLKVAVSARARTSFLMIVSLFPSSAQVEIRKHTMSVIKNCSGLAESEDLQAEIRMAHKLIISSGWFSNLYKALSDILESAASKFQLLLNVKSAEPPSHKKKKSKVSKKVFVKPGQADQEGFMNSGEANFNEEYALASSAAWQLKDLLMSEETQNAMLNAITESTLSALGIISEACILHCISQENLDISPVLTYMSIAMHLSLKNVSNTHQFDCNNSFSGETVLGNSLKCLIKCTKSMFETGNEASCQPGSESAQKNSFNNHKSTRKRKTIDDDSTATANAVLIGARKTSHILKLATSILKFIVDSASAELILLDEPVWLQFSLAYTQYATLIFRNHQHKDCPFNEEAFLCSKSTLSYDAKLLNLLVTKVETSALQHETSLLANYIFDLVLCMESCFGVKYASRLVSIAKPWLPDLILGLCFAQLDRTSQNSPVTTSYCPLWLTILGKFETQEAEANSDSQLDAVQESRTSVANKLLELIVNLLEKGDKKIKDALAVGILSHAKSALERGDFHFALELIQFSCSKLIGIRRSPLDDLEITSSCLQEISSWIKDTLANHNISNDVRDTLEAVHNLIKGSL